jgi:hypothetical protein
VNWCEGDPPKRALTWHGTEDVRVSIVPGPDIVSPSDGEVAGFDPRLDEQREPLENEAVVPGEVRPVVLVVGRRRAEFDHRPEEVAVLVRQRRQEHVVEDGLEVGLGIVGPLQRHRRLRPGRA